MILIIIKFCELFLRISPIIINSLRSYIKHSKECFLLFPSTSKLVKKNRLRLVFPTYFSVFGNRRKLSSSCLIYYIKHRMLIRRRFIDIKSLHVMYYRPFDRSMGLWIINEFLKGCVMTSILLIRNPSTIVWDRYIFLAYPDVYWWFYGPPTSCHVLMFSVHDSVYWLFTTWLRDRISITSCSGRIGYGLTRAPAFENTLLISSLNFWHSCSVLKWALPWIYNCIC